MKHRRDRKFADKKMRINGKKHIDGGLEIKEGLDLPYVLKESPNNGGVNYETAMKTAINCGLEIDEKEKRFYAPELTKYNFNKNG